MKRMYFIKKCNVNPVERQGLSVRGNIVFVSSNRKQKFIARKIHLWYNIQDYGQL